MEYYASIKISIFGDSGNGKTSLINRFINNSFTLHNDATMGIDCKIKIIDIQDKKLKVFIWDTAGQERFAPIIKSCYRAADGIIITYDTTNYESFKHLDKWMNEIKSIVDTDKIEIMLVGTKSDLYLERQVPIEEVIDFVTHHNIRYLETSAKEGTNIDIVFSIFAEKIYNKKIKNNEIILRKNKVQLLKNENLYTQMYSYSYPSSYPFSYSSYSC